MATKSPEIGKLQPIRDVITGIADWESKDRELRGDTDDVVRALGIVRRRLLEAMEAAEDPTTEISIEQYCELKRINRDAAYKRYQTGKIPGARKDAAGHIKIPIAAVAA